MAQDIEIVGDIFTAVPITTTLIDSPSLEIKLADDRRAALEVASAMPCDIHGHPLAIGDRVIVVATGWDYLIEAIDRDGTVYLELPHGNMTDCKGQELEYWGSFDADKARERFRLKRNAI